MKLQRIITLSIVIFLTTLEGHSQENKSLENIFFDGSTLDRNQIQYNKPKHFTLKDDEYRLECIVSDNYKGLYPVFYNQLISSDSNFIACVKIPPVYSSKEDSNYVDCGRLIELKYKFKINTYHIHYMAVDFWSNTGNTGDIPKSLDGLPVEYKSSKYAHETFNADTVATYPLQMRKEYNGYNHCQVIMIQKNYRGFIFLYCLYNDKGAKKLNQYIKALNKVFWYREPKDYIEVTKP